MELQYVAQKHPVDEALGCSSVIAITLIGIIAMITAFAKFFSEVF